MTDGGTKWRRQITDVGTKWRRRITDCGTKWWIRMTDGGTKCRKRIMDSGKKWGRRMTDSGTKCGWRIMESGSKWERLLTDGGAEQEVHRCRNQLWENRDGRTCRETALTERGTHCGKWETLTLCRLRCYVSDNCGTVTLYIDVSPEADQEDN